ncbi:MAG TPA: 3-phosphoserine/phosphohydroxythreonine transaminase [Tepidisphaeraceae bacterium]|jgi:phosphoserine aminotransferase|nr:3-phosphoserine/phosphohydroxythreonine transaminase [Tepidisphaeraceae bacterium]
MSHRIFNFSAGPAMLPTEVLEKSAAALLDYQGKGFGIAEVSHRGKEFDGVMDEAIARCKKLLNLGDAHDVVFLQGGATALFTLIPMNFLNTNADYLVSGEWSKKAIGAAKDLGKVTNVASSEASNFDHSPLPSEWKLSSDADYFHVCSNETVHGHRLPTWPKHPNLIVDASSEFMSRPHPVNDCALVYGGAQKNLGPSGLVLAIVRKDLYATQKKVPSKLWSFKDQADNKSMINTPPTFGVYILLEVFRWLEAQGGLAAMEKTNAKKAGLIYDTIDDSNGFYTGTVSVRDQRSHMNVTYRLPSEELTDEFVKTAARQDMVGLKGYRTVGGIRASIYNAMPVEGCQALAQFMKDFASKKS